MLRKFGKVYYTKKNLGGGIETRCSMLFFDTDTWNIYVGWEAEKNPSGNKGAALWALRSGKRLDMFLSNQKIIVTNLERRRGITEKQWETMMVFNAL